MNAKYISCLSLLLLTVYPAIGMNPKSMEKSANKQEETMEEVPLSLLEAMAAEYPMGGNYPRSFTPYPAIGMNPEESDQTRITQLTPEIQSFFENLKALPSQDQKQIITSLFYSVGLNFSKQETLKIAGQKYKDRLNRLYSLLEKNPAIKDPFMEILRQKLR